MDFSMALNRSLVQIKFHSDNIHTSSADIMVGEHKNIETTNLTKLHRTKLYFLSKLLQHLLKVKSNINTSHGGLQEELENIVWGNIWNPIFLDGTIL